MNIEETISEQEISELAQTLYEWKECSDFLYPPDFEDFIEENPQTIEKQKIMNPLESKSKITQKPLFRIRKNVKLNYKNSEQDLNETLNHLIDKIKNMTNNQRIKLKEFLLEIEKDNSAQKISTPKNNKTIEKSKNKTENIEKTSKKLFISEEISKGLAIPFKENEFLSSSDNSPQFFSLIPSYLLNESHSSEKPTPFFNSPALTSNFRIPILPSGSKLIFIIKSTWGDSSYVGLSGIEIFDQDGRQKKIMEISDRKNRVKINDNSPVDLLFDGFNRTCDEKHMWLTKINNKDNQDGIKIDIDLKTITRISMIRIWNYNQSRIHSFRGVKDLIISLDDIKIFEGEIKKSPGCLNGCEKFCEIIMFSDDCKIINLIAENDWLNIFLEENDLSDNDNIDDLLAIYERPKTSTKIFKENEILEMKLFIQHINQNKNNSLNLKQKEEIIDYNKNFIEDYEMLEIPSGCFLKLVLLSTWDDPYYIGLNGIAIYDENGNQIQMKDNVENIYSEPNSMDIEDKRIIYNILNGINCTYDDNNMWLSNLQNNIMDSLKNNTIFIKFKNYISISNINFWNYSKSPSRGVKNIEIYFDEKIIYQGILKKSPIEKSFKEEQQMITSVLFTKNKQLIKKIKPVVYNYDTHKNSISIYDEKKIIQKN